MKNIKIDGKSFIAINYNQYIVNNLSLFGCAIFDSLDHQNLDFATLKKELLSENSFKKMFAFPIFVYNHKTKDIHKYLALLNVGRVSPSKFFDKVKLVCNKHQFSKFYACDFEEDKILEITPSSVLEYGKLNKFKNLLKLDDNNQIIDPWIEGYDTLEYLKIYDQANVFRNGADNEYYLQYGKRLMQNCEKKPAIDVYYSLDECKDKLNSSCLEFDKITMLEEDIDNPDLTIKATILKARKLNVKSIEAKKLFCDDLKCEKVKAWKIYADAIDCQEIDAASVSINLENGMKFLSPQ